jgi:Tfp pilus assembly protein PilW
MSVIVHLAADAQTTLHFVFSIALRYLRQAGFTRCATGRENHSK